MESAAIQGSTNPAPSHYTDSQKALHDAIYSAGEEKATGKWWDPILDLSTTDAEIINILDGRESDADRMLFSAVLNQRLQRVSTFTNILKTMHEAVMSVARNLRLQ